MTDLAQCPFCGGDAEFSEGHIFTFAKCSDCGAGSKGEFKAANAIAAWNRRASPWRTDMENAPKDAVILGWGQPDDDPSGMLCFTAPGAYSMYWDEIDQAWCITGATWIGPFIAPTAWMPIPPFEGGGA